MLANKLMGKTSEPIYIEDVFSTYLYTGNGSTQTINNGIDLAGKGGLVWTKSRTTASGHRLSDTARGIYQTLFTNTTDAQVNDNTYLTAFNADGFSLGATNNQNTTPYASWTFRKQPKFFDVVTYTGNGSGPRQIAHNLGSVPGCIIIKAYSGGDSGTDPWIVYHRSVGNTAALYLNQTDAAVTSANWWNNTSPTDTNFTVNTSSYLNQSGEQYVAYLFAHDAGGFGLTGTDNVISCGSYVDNTTGIINVNLGYEVQWLLCKPATSINDWFMVDTMRGASVTSAQYLYANKSNAEMGPNTGLWYPTATGFSIQGSNSGDTVIYIAIRRGPMKVPTDGTKVFSPNQVNAVGGTKVTTNFPVDLQIARFNQSTITDPPKWADRLRGVSTTDTEFAIQLQSSGTGAESSAPSLARYWDNTGFKTASYYADAQDIYWNFRRAPGFFDEVCYTGTGSAMTVNHNLGVAPELMIVKSRSAATDWYVKPPTGNNNSYLRLNATAADAPGSGAALWNSTAPTSTVFTVGTAGGVNTSGATYVAYLFASCPGVSKVGSYTGTGAAQTINCGFTGGARFVLIKRTDSTGDWYVWDSARGIVSGNDPYLLLNSTAAEVTTTDYIDPVSSGFEISSTAPAAINASGGSYIFLAIA